MNNEQKYPWFLQLNAPDDSRSKSENDAPAKPPAAPDDSDDGGQKHDGHDTLPPDTMGLALSGGGIRSATFCLGIIQALAKADWLKRLDYLSTVSGGGYIGSFLGRFFDISRDPDLVQQLLVDSRSQPINWLRSHSNYLSPKGLGDTVFNLTSFWRNFFSLQFVLVFFLFAVLGAANAIAYASWNHSFLGSVVSSGIELVLPLAPLTAAMFSDSQFITPWLTAAEILIWLAVVPLSAAYWVVSQDRNEDFILPVLAVAFIFAVAVLLASLWAGIIVVFAALIFWILFTWKRVKQREGHGNPNSRFHMALARNYLTNILSFWSAITFIVFVVALVDSIGRYLAILFLQNGSSLTAVYSMLGGSLSLLGLVPILRGLATYLASSDDQRTGILATLAKIPYLPTLVILFIAGVIPLALISFMSHTVYELGRSWWIGLAATGVAALISILLGRQSLISFVNRSGNLTIYSARLARVFLGAVNPLRHRNADGKNIGHVIYGDDLPLYKYEPHLGGGPLHLINVAVNETIDVASQRGIRDRQAENMAIGPAGINLSKSFHALWTNNPKNPCELKPLGDLTSAHPFLSNERQPVEVESLNLREWTAISGAAFSPGMGRATSLARSLLFTITNLRLGYWWNSGLVSRNRFRVPIKSGIFRYIKDLFYRFFAPHALLLSESIGRFGGPWRKHWYLTDGGHFELTGAYELLRRRVPFIVVVDVGADKKRQGAVLAWLIRLSRIDFGAEFNEIDPKRPGGLRIPADVVKHLGSSKELLASSGANKHAVLFRVEFPKSEAATDSWHGRDHSWLLYIRASVVGDEPADVRSYQHEHPDFPNESTLDQFFDEPQWESYRKLGEFIGGKFFQ